MCSPFSIKSLPEAVNTIEKNLETIERDKRFLHRTQAALNYKRNSYISPVNLLPPELLAYIFTAAVAPISRYSSPNAYLKRDISQVCSRWRQVALDVCPVWDKVSLTFYDTSGDEPGWAEIGLVSTPGRRQDVSVRRPLGVADAQYTRMVLDTIAPYMKQLDNAFLAANNVERLRPFLKLWLEKGVPGSFTDLNLSLDEAALVFPESNSHLSDRLNQHLKGVETLALSSVALDWSSVAFVRLTSMSLSDLPPFCCPTLAQLARVLSTCPSLCDLRVERITILTSPDIVTPVPAALEDLDRLTLKEVDVAALLSIISPGQCEMDLELEDLNDDTGIFEPLRSFASKANILTLTLTLSETRPDVALTQLFHYTGSSLLDLECLTLADMNIRDSELRVLASHSLTQTDQILSSVSVGHTNELFPLGNLLLKSCVIHATPVALHDAIFAFSVTGLILNDCKYSYTAQGAGNSAMEVCEPIHYTSDFGTELSELMPDLLEIYNL
ncbi:hypothetical protein BDV93DRAFT_608026 [Ceratobasidium sp. AG-I]|nr:hypothetical protein BDV93DRAFT_608026 [Ceratobasidium sp. AG-I]